MKSRMLGCNPFTTVFNLNLWLCSTLLIETTWEKMWEDRLETQNKRDHMKRCCL